MSPAIFTRIADAMVSCGQTAPCSTGLPVIGATNANVNVILQIVFGLIGAAALIIIIIAGLQFITAQGDPQGITKARQTIIYALIGLAVAVSAEAIVTFVLGRL